MTRGYEQWEQEGQLSNQGEGSSRGESWDEDWLYEWKEGTLEVVVVGEQ